MKADVAIVTGSSRGYPAKAPYHPSEAFPEYPFPQGKGSGDSTVYAQIRRGLYDLGLDQENFGQETWNPLGALVQPGSTVLIKPNMVLHQHPRSGSLECLITHASVIRPVLDYLHIAMKGEGRVLVGDSPLQGTRFSEVVERNGLRDLLEWFGVQSGLSVELVDFRQVHALFDERNHVAGWKEVPGDPRGYVEYDLGADSALQPLGCRGEEFRVSNYKARDTAQYHRPGSHRYVIAGSVVEADLVINMPKLKTHCKVGVTLAMKNFVGTVGRKQCLAHHRHGGASGGGDEYPSRSMLKALSTWLESAIDGNANHAVRSVLKLLYRINERLIKTFGIDPLRDGGWYGNDTAWRMVYDLVRIARFGDREGTLQPIPQRPILSIIDGIVAGENEGPLESTPVESGTVVMGFEPVLADMAATVWMGLNPHAVPLLAHADLLRKWKLVPDGWDAESWAAADALRLNGEAISMEALKVHPDRFSFIPAAGWTGHIELQPEQEQQEL